MLQSKSPNSEQNWMKNGNLEQIVNKDRNLLYKSFGGIEQLKSLFSKNEIDVRVYNREMKQHFRALSLFVESKIENEEEAKLVTDFFIVNKQSYSAAGLFTFTTVLLYLAVGLTLIGLLMILALNILPLLYRLSKTSKIFLGYMFATTIIFSTLFISDSYTHVIVAFIGVFTLSGAYFFHLSCLENVEVSSMQVKLTPLFVIWSTAAVYFNSKLIGFFAVAVLQAIMGFYIMTGPLSTTIGFKDDYSIFASLVTSAFSLFLYIAYILYFKKLLMRPYTDYVTVFETGVLFLCTFVMFTSLLILSSKFYRGNYYITFNCITFSAGVFAFYMGSIDPSLGYFRGVGSTFFVIFIMQKYIEILWENFQFALFGGGVLVVSICLYAKSHPNIFLIV